MGDVIPAASRMVHGSHVLNVHKSREVSWLLEAVEALLFHHCPEELIGALRQERSLKGYAKPDLPMSLSLAS